jgi:hypothetical protein
MRHTIKFLIFSLFFVLTANAQSSTTDVLSLTATDLSEAEAQGAEAFKILPRGMLDYEKNELQVRGGGAYYSFVKKSHDYDETPQIELQQNYLSVAFYGANYGFIADLGKTPLIDVSRENKSTDFLFNYAPKKYEAEAREEYRRIGKGFESGGLNYNQRQTAIVGHTYILRAISYDEADTLIAFQIYRKEADGSLIIFWKLLENFEKPTLIRNEQAALTNNVNFISINFSGTLAAKVEAELKKRGFDEVEVSEENNLLVLRGKIPKGKMSKVFELTEKLNGGKPVRNELTEK